MASCSLETVNPQSNIQNSQIPQECRICLIQASQGLLLLPCKCNGSVGGIHDTCFMNWVESTKYKKQKSQEGVSEIRCQICLGKIRFQLNEERQCNKKCQLSKRRILIFIPFIVLISVFSYFAISGLKQGIVQEDNGKIIASSILIFIDCMLMIGFACGVYNICCLRKEDKIHFLK